MIDGIKDLNIKPIITPLSNPTERSEATAQELIEWTDGKALIATGSPFKPITYNNRTYEIAQSNNAVVFPGIGLGVCISKAKELTDNMLWAACEVLSENSPILQDPTAPLLPRLKDAYKIAPKIALAVAKQAMLDGVSDKISDQELELILKQKLWQPEYLPIKLLK